MRTVAILPVKTFGRAKQRLGQAFPDRPALAAAMVADVLEALAAVPSLDGVIVVTAEPIAARIAAEMGAQAGRVLLVPGDCRGLDPDEVEALLARTARVVIVPDRHGTGTNALVLAPPDVMAPA